MIFCCPHAVFSHLTESHDFLPQKNVTYGPLPTGGVPRHPTKHVRAAGDARCVPCRVFPRRLDFPPTFSYSTRPPYYPFASILQQHFPPPQRAILCPPTRSRRRAPNARKSRPRTAESSASTGTYCFPPARTVKGPGHRRTRPRAASGVRWRGRARAAAPGGTGTRAPHPALPCHGRTDPH